MKLENEKRSSDAAKEYKNPDPWFIVPKALYFLLNWLVYSPHAYIFQFIGAKWGLDSSTLNAALIFQIFNFFGAMYWGSLADRTRQYKLIATLCVICSSVFTCAMAFPLGQGSIRIWYYFLITAGQCFFSAGTFPMIDAIVLSVLEADPTAGKDFYGRQKLYGTIAHNINAKVIHYVYEHFGQDFFVMYYSAIGSMLALVLTLLYGVGDTLKIKAHKHHGPAKTTHGEEEQKAPEGNSTFGLLKNPTFAFFLVSILASGIVRSVNTNNHSVFITDFLLMDKSMVGDLMLARLPCEIGLLFFAKNLMGIMGPYWFMILGQLAGVIRVILYLILQPMVSHEAPYSYILIVIEMLKGANSSMVSAAAFRIASDLAPPAWSGAAQTLVAGVWQGVSMALGAAIASLVLSLTEDSLWWVFAVTAIIGTVSFVAIFVYYSIIDPVLFTKKVRSD